MSLAAYLARVRDDDVWRGRTDLREVPVDLRKRLSLAASERAKVTGKRWKPTLSVVNGEPHYFVTSDLAGNRQQEVWLGCDGVIWNE